MEPNLAYNVFQQSTNEEMYEVPEESRGALKQEAAKKLQVDLTALPARKVRKIRLFSLLSVLALAVALAAVVLSLAALTTDSKQSTQTQQDIQALNSSINNIQTQQAETLMQLVKEIKHIQDVLNNSVIPNLSYTAQVVEEALIGTLPGFPATSCKDISQDKPSGPYWIQANRTSSPVQVFCDTNPRNCSCNNNGGWARITNIDMTDPNQTCPDEFNLITTPRRTCGRPDGSGGGCVSTTFPIHGIEYSRVCGRIVAYQFGSPEAFRGYNELSQTSIDGYYLSGISLTYGQSPRQHIWSFVNAVSDGGFIDYNDRVCPCTRTRSNGTYTATVPPFIGEDYFCDSGTSSGFLLAGVLYQDDPLWDGQGCGGTSTCCEFNNPPWFCKQLPQPTTDDVELRLCENSLPSIDDSPFEVVELFIN